jgi:hypothetical protein
MCFSFTVQSIFIALFVQVKKKKKKKNKEIKEYKGGDDNLSVTKAEL